MPTRYTGPIIDPHHHLWDLALDRHPWLAGAGGGADNIGDLAAIRRDYLPEDYRRDAGAWPVVATVHVEASWRADDCLGETNWLETLDKTTGVALRYVAHVPLAADDAAALIAAQAASPRVVGVRDILSWHADPAKSFAARPDIMDDPAWRAGLACLGEHGLGFDLMLFPSQMPDALRLARDFPEMQFIVNHAGSPIDRDADGMAHWRAGIALLASAPNVAIKISDLVAYDHDWTLDSLQPVILHCIESFGVDRAMFASDFPVAGLHATFDEVYESFFAAVADFSEGEQRALFFDTARRLYRLADDVPAMP
jgi:predicted TIM-barrel fold metal-dependent hydrolase